jgi:hypothetical protein
MVAICAPFHAADLSSAAKGKVLVAADGARFGCFTARISPFHTRAAGTILITVLGGSG